MSIRSSACLPAARLLLPLALATIAASPAAHAADLADAFGRESRGGPLFPYGSEDRSVIVESGRLPGPRRPARAVTGGPGYVGSDWGLGKPSFYGLGSRPDWGRSSTD